MAFVPTSCTTSSCTTSFAFPLPTQDQKQQRGSPLWAAPTRKNSRNNHNNFNPRHSKPRNDNTDYNAAAAAAEKREDEYIRKTFEHFDEDLEDEEYKDQFGDFEFDDADEEDPIFDMDSSASFQNANEKEFGAHFFSRKPLGDPSFTLETSASAVENNNDIFERLCRGAGITRPSRIQSVAWPVLLQGKHAIVADQTGSGMFCFCLFVVRICTGNMC